MTNRIYYQKPDETLSNGAKILWTTLEYKFSKNQKRMLPMVNIQCVCGKTRTIIAHKILNRENIGICMKCGWVIDKDRTEGHRNLRWRGGRLVNNRGYVSIHHSLLSEPEREKFVSMFSRRNGNRWYILEHRLVMARLLDRPLTTDEHVHHRNGNKEDNRIENLELLSQHEHSTVEHKYYAELIQARAEIQILRDEIEKLKSGK